MTLLGAELQLVRAHVIARASTRRGCLLREHIASELPTKYIPPSDPMVFRCRPGFPTALLMGEVGRGKMRPLLRRSTRGGAPRWRLNFARACSGCTRLWKPRIRELHPTHMGRPLARTPIPRAGILRPFSVSPSPPLLRVAYLNGSASSSPSMATNSPFSCTTLIRLYLRHSFSPNDLGMCPPHTCFASRWQPGSRFCAGRWFLAVARRRCDGILVLENRDTPKCPLAD